MTTETASWIITCAGIAAIVIMFSVDVYGAFRERGGNPFWSGYMTGRRSLWNWMFQKR